MTEQTPAPSDDVSLVAVDGRDALAYVIVRPSRETPGSVEVEAAASGMDKHATAYVLSDVAQQFAVEAAAEAIVEEQRTEATQAALDRLLAYTRAHDESALDDEEQQPESDWVDDVRAALAFNAPEAETALATFRDVLLNDTPRAPEQALAAARIILAAHTRELSAAVRQHADDYREQHSVTRSTRGLLVGMGNVRRMLDHRADHLDERPQQ